jgi:hypothetical protein
MALSSPRWGGWVSFPQEIDRYDDVRADAKRESTLISSQGAFSLGVAQSA